MKLSSFGEKLTNGSGIVDLMQDLGSALNENPNMIFMGGGNPARIPEMEAVFKAQYKKLIESSEQLYSTAGVYQSPQGELGFRRDIASMLKQEYGWQLKESNIAVSNGSQSAFYILFNLLAGQMPDGSFKSIHLPLTPEYIGYNDLGLSDNFFTGSKPEIELIGDDQFKYHVNFDDLSVGEDTAALCVSRPTNPTANMLTDDEIKHLDSLAKQADIPLIIDGAYGVPFPNINFVDVEPHWNNNTVLVLSLSKLGLPGVRTGIVIANEQTIQAFSSANTVINLASGNMGPSLTRDLFASNAIIELSKQYIQPFYKQRSQQVMALFQQAMTDIPCRTHLSEGAIFLWLWFEGLPITSEVLYQRLKQRGVLVVSGHHFFAGIDDQWPHQHQCIRVSYGQDFSQIEQGIKIIAEEAKLAYQQG
ncbi:MAG: valine--pyruvate transaminase [Porticoccaceae bacterium]|nr:valine--pyruvate transaminase [Porticoccaceae bacterium]